MTAPAAPVPTSASRLIRSSALVGLGTMLSRFTGLLRVIVLLAVLGGGGKSDPLAEAYNLANTTPNMVYDLLLGGILSATLVPVFVDLVRDEDEDGISAVMTAAITALVAITIAAMLAAPAIFGIYTAGKNPAQARLLSSAGVPLLRWFLPQILFYGLTALATALLNARKSFLAPAFAPVLNNVVVIAILAAIPMVAGKPLTLATVVSTPALMITLGLGTTAGIVAMTLALLPAWRATGTKLRVNYDLQHPALRRVVGLSGWTLGYVMVNQLAYLVITNLATRVDGVTPYAYGFAFFQLPYGLFAVSIMTTFAPDLAAMASARDYSAFRRRFMLGFRLLMLVIVPAAAGCVVLGPSILGALTLVGHRFTEKQALVIGQTFSMFALGLIGFSVYLYAMRGFYAMKNTRFPFFAAILQNGLNILFAIVLFGPLRVQGLALSYSLSYTLAGVAALAALRYRIHSLNGRLNAPMLARVCLATVAMAIWVAVVVQNVGGPYGWEAVVRVLAGILVGGAVLGICLRLLRVRELDEITSRIRRRLPGG